MKEKYFECGIGELEHHNISIYKEESVTDDGEYVFVIYDSEESHPLVHMTFESAWKDFRQTHFGWWDLEPSFIHDKVQMSILLELRTMMKKINQTAPNLMNYWRTEVRPHWINCFRKMIKGLVPA